MAVTALHRTPIDVEKLVLKAKVKALLAENRALKRAAALSERGRSLRRRTDSTYSSLTPSSCSSPSLAAADWVDETTVWDLDAHDDVDDRTDLISQDEGYPETPSTEASAFTWTDEDWTAPQADWVDSEEPKLSSPSAFPDPWSSEPSCSAELDVVDRDLAALEKVERETRLTDRAFYLTPAGHAGIPLANQQRLMEEARMQARQALYDVLGKYWPEGQTKYYFHGPISVRFGREELNTTIGCEASKRIAEGLANGTDMMSIESTLNDTIALRNALSHQEWLPSSRVDQLMQYAQAFVCSLADEERALGIRDIRDRLQKETEESFAGLIKCRPLTTVPEPHHHEVFRVVNNGLEESWREPELIKTHSVEVVRLAKEWAQRYRRPGRERSDFKA